MLELTYNHDGRTYELGTGYGHIAIGVDDLDGTLARLKEQGIEPERPPYQVREGGSWLCFVRDPDDYRIEIIEPRLDLEDRAMPADLAPAPAEVRRAEESEPEAARRLPGTRPRMVSIP